jgi:hypothetical protein
MVTIQPPRHQGTKAQRRNMNYKTSRLTSGGQVPKREESIAENLRCRVYHLKSDIK